jgi:uncharacterized protein
VDQLLRDGVLVDLWNVVRPALRISDRSRSIKKLEPLYMADAPAREGVKDAASSVVEYAEYTALREAGRLEEAAERRRQILEYNRYDCLSTLRLLEWLREAAGERPAAGPAVDAGPVDVAEPAEPTQRRLDTAERTARRIALETEIHELVEAERGRAPDDELRALSLLGSAIGYYRREAKPYWHEYYARLELPPDEWPGRRSAMVVERAVVLRGWAVEDGRSTLSRELRLEGRPVEGSELGTGSPVVLLYDQPVPPVVGELDARAVRGVNRRAIVLDARRERVPVSDDEPDRIVERDVLVVREALGTGMGGHEQLPMGAVVSGHVPCDAQEQAVEDTAARALAAWRAAASRGDGSDRGADGGAPRLPVGPATDLLLRRPPRLVGGRALPAPVTASGSGDGLVDAVHDAVRRLDRSYLAVQGPPGTGKTHVGSHVIARLVDAGWRVAVVAQSHAVVENLLAATLRAGVPATAVAKKARDQKAVASAPAWAELQAKDLPGFAADAEAAGRGCVVGGTCWDFANLKWPEEGLDLLVVDEAGQFSVANTVAVARAARRLLLLGDPQQLPQVSKGRHPEPAVAGSALRWLADTSGTSCRRRTACTPRSPTPSRTSRTRGGSVRTRSPPSAGSRASRRASTRCSCPTRAARSPRPRRPRRSCVRCGTWSGGPGGQGPDSRSARSPRPTSSSSRPTTRRCGRSAGRSTPRGSAASRSARSTCSRDARPPSSSSRSPRRRPTTSRAACGSSSAGTASTSRCRGASGPRWSSVHRG